MGKKVARAAGLTGLAAGLLALAGAAAAPALAATADTGGTFSIGIPKGHVASLAKAGIVVLTTGPGTAAVVNAVLDALKPYGVRHADMPLTPTQV